MSLIKFPTQIPPARLTVALARVDETIRSPLTNVQQVASRGNPVWKWTYEYTDLSDSERDIVHAFLMKCRGSVNTFKVTDPGDYEPKGSVSDWIDVFSGYGAFIADAGADDSSVNSWFAKSPRLDANINEDESVRFEWRRVTGTSNIGWKGHGGGVQVNSFQAGATYVQRIKSFNGVGPRSFNFQVGSDAVDLFGVQHAPTLVASDDSITAPFYTTNNSYIVYVQDSNAGPPKIGEHFYYADYRLQRCALIANSEQLLTRSNDFAHADWTAINLNVESGWWDASPVGVNSGGWKIYGNTSVNTEHRITQAITKPMTEDIYTMACYARVTDFDMGVLFRMYDSVNNGVTATFDAASGTIQNLNNAGVGSRPHAKAWPVGSNTYRCQLSGMVSSLNNLSALIFVVTSDGTQQYTADGSSGIEIFGASLRKFPYMGPYIETGAAAIVGTGSQTGSRLILDGFEAGDILKAGQRFEVVNRFNNVNSSYFERTEFKRITEEVKTHREGSAIIDFDPPIRNAPVPDRFPVLASFVGETMHNPVIFHNPEMKGRLLSGTIQYTDKPLRATDISFEVLEDMTE